jgi:hypothetical protein
VRGVEAAGVAGDLRQLRQLRHVGVHAGHVLQAGGQPDRARVERRLKIAAHRRPLRRIGFAVGQAHRPLAQRAVSGKRCDVDGDAAFGHPAQVSRQIVPVQRHPGPIQPAALPRELRPGLGQSQREAAVAHDLRGHALRQRGLHARREQHGQVGVGVDVDKAGADEAAGGVDHAPRRRGR